MKPSNGDRLKIALLLVGFGGLATGLILHIAGRPDLAQTVCFAGVIPVLAALLVEILRGLDTPPSASAPVITQTSLPGVHPK
ncbi:hypothetical protein Snov_1165 [Ancylobacter novellus DSM 506]|uniref:Uncharacterized protein n=1 Tax=Ancylobacter novellus (strain ATCC 8093 / DSM 506 / JCM 20403 / CCM 1077 / IAM 12100 / NBRC 12443 / NCIMB 10456) TaxID=639283 RepID=D7A7N6_ANCN5|nr:hypothetical protein Snov_1165 [Ancylobacter novellus DSM 506]